MQDETFLCRKSRVDMDLQRDEGQRVTVYGCRLGKGMSTNYENTFNPVTSTGLVFLVPMISAVRSVRIFVVFQYVQKSYYVLRNNNTRKIRLLMNQSTDQTTDFKNQWLLTLGIQEVKQNKVYSDSKTVQRKIVQMSFIMRTSGARK